MAKIRHGSDGGDHQISARRRLGGDRCQLTALVSAHFWQKSVSFFYARARLTPSIVGFLPCESLRNTFLSCTGKKMALLCGHSAYVAKKPHHSSIARV